MTIAARRELVRLRMMGRLLMVVVGISMGFGALLASGCVTTRYTGETYGPTTDVEVFDDEGEIGRPYAIIGTATARVSQTLPRHAVVADLIREAKSKGRTRSSSPMMSWRPSVA